MQTYLSVKSAFNSKSLRLSFLFILLPLFFHAQSLTGLWVGALHNDSSTVRKDQSFEIVLTEYKGKVFGYSRSEFIVNDTLYYIVKRVKGTIEGDVCEVTDDEIIAYNFRGKLDKGIKVTSTFRRNQNDSSWYLDGTWKTNANRKYYSVSGKVSLEEEKDLSASKIFPHLEELKKADDIAFYKERKEGAPIVKIAKPERINAKYIDKAKQIQDGRDLSSSVHQPDLPKTEIKPPVVAAMPDPVVITENKRPGENTSAGKETSAIKNQESETTPVRETAQSIRNSTTISVADDGPVGEQTGDKKTEKSNAVAIKKNNNNTKSEFTGTTQSENINRAEDIVAITTPTDKNNSLPASAIKKQEGNPSKINTEGAKPIIVAEKKDVVASPLDKQKVPDTKTQPLAILKKPETRAAVSTNTISNKTEDNEKVTSVPAPQATNTLSNTNAPKKEIIPLVPAVVKNPAEDPIKKSAVIEGRKSEFSQEVNFKTDSLVLSLYDNGEIDGDTVSIYLNGEVIMASQGLKSSAIRKTIHLPEGSETFTLVMFAESLGKYPPNTGLLVIRDGDDIYNLRFSSDFQKSSGIVFRRKK